MTGSLGLVTRGLPALRRQFPHVDAEAVALFMDPSGGRPEDEAMAALGEMQKEAGSASNSSGMGAPTRGCTVRQAAAEASETSGAPGSIGFLELVLEGGDGPPHVGTVLVISGLRDLLADEDSVEFSAAAVVLPSGEVLALEAEAFPTSCFLAQDFGMHELRVRLRGGAVGRCQFMVSSSLGEFGEALDLFNDAYDWAWDGGWTEDLEDAAISLLVALDDHYESLIARSGNGGGMMGEPFTVTSTFSGPKIRIDKHLAKAIEAHDTLALGRAVASVRGFIISQSLHDMFGQKSAGGPLNTSVFYEAVIAFERARFTAASAAKQTEVNGALRRLVLAADAHVADLANSRTGKGFAERWSGGLREELWQMLVDPEAVIHPLPFQQLRGGGGGYVADMMASMMDGFGSASSSSVGRAETTEAMSQLSPQLTFETAEAKVSRWVESLVDEQVGFGSPMTPFELHAGEPWVHTVIACTLSVLSLGLGYVSSNDKFDPPAADVSSGDKGAKLVALLDRVRAALPLHSPSEFLQDRRRRDRLKDVCRVVRAARKKGQRLVLSVNTDFAGALRLLREHHTDSWVGPCLEAVWAKLRSQKMVFAFELWLHEAGKEPRIVAADFGHPHTCGRAYYVATRFFDREARTLQPGFVLAFAEAECLRRAGFELWDLGGADRSPMMQYKPQVAIEMHRSEFMRRLREVAAAAAAEEDAAGPGRRSEQRRLPLTEPSAPLRAGGERVPTGIVFEDIDEDAIWGSSALQAQELRAKSCQAAAVRAAKESKAAKGCQKEQARRNAKKDAKEEAPAEAVASRKGRAAEAVAKPPPKEASPPAPGPVLAEAETGGDPKAEAKKQFHAIFQQLLAEGVSQNEAAARALRAVQSPSVA